MSDKYPEWFIGGPLHGLDKLQEYPDTKDWAAVIAEDLSISDGQRPSLSDQERWLYRRSHMTFGSITIYFWWNGRLTSSEEALCKLADLIMKPHVLKEVTATDDERV